MKQKCLREFSLSLHQSQVVNSASHFVSSLPMSTPTTTVFPLPLICLPSSTHLSYSRRVKQSRARCRIIYSIANDCIRSLNTLHFNFPSNRYSNAVSWISYQRSTDPSSAQLRMLNHIIGSSADLITRSRHHTKNSNSNSNAAISSYGMIPGPNHYTEELPAPSSSVPITSSSSSCLSETSACSLFISQSSDVALMQYPPTTLLSLDRSVSVPSSYDSTSLEIIPIVAEAVALPDNLNHVSLLSLVPTNISSVYSSPTQLLLPDSQVATRLHEAQLSKPKVLGEHSEYILLVKRMLKLGMLDLTSSPKCINGLFGTPKPDGATRLILDARWANCFFIDPPHVELPSPTHFSQLVVGSKQKFTVAKLDLSNFYHQLTLPEWIRSYFSLPALSVSELSELSECEDVPLSIRSILQSGTVQRVFPCCTTLPMGFSHSVFLAQTVHEHLLYSSGVLFPKDNILNLQTPNVFNTIHALYIDDCCLISPDGRHALELYSSIVNAYILAGLPVKLSKCQPPTFDPVAVLGVEINGGHGQVATSVERHRKLISATSFLFRCHKTTGKQLAAIIGGWTWQLLLRRPSLVVFKHCYRFIQQFMNTEKKLWPCVVRELKVVIALSPLLKTNLRSQLATKILATDSSSYAAGIVSTYSSSDLQQTLLPLSSSLHSSLLINTSSKTSLSDILTAPGPTLCQPTALFRRVEQHQDLTSIITKVEPLVSTTKWDTVVSSMWKHESHINSLELQSVLLAVRWWISHPQSPNSRLMFLTDSSVVLYALRKGRSSSLVLSTLLRRCSALTLASGVTLLPIWVPSSVNPADKPSRKHDAEINDYD